MMILQVGIHLLLEPGKRLKTGCVVTWIKTLPLGTLKKTNLQIQNKRKQGRREELGANDFSKDKLRIQEIIGTAVLLMAGVAISCLIL